MSHKTWIHLGPGKSGSTWLYNFIKVNTHLFAPALLKETQLFHHSSSNFLSFYPSVRTDSPVILCDFSNTYIFNPFVVKHLRAYSKANGADNVCFTVLLRCPIKRAISHFFYLKASGLISQKTNFSSYVERDPSILWRSRYDIHLHHLHQSGIDVKIFILEQQSLSSPEILNYVLSSLLLSAQPFALNQPPAESNFSRMKSRSRLLSGIAKNISFYLREAGYYQLLSGLKDSTFIRSLFTAKDSSSFHLDDDLKMILLDYFLPTKQYLYSRGYDVNNVWLE